MHRRHLLRTLAVLPALAPVLKAWAGGAADREETGSLHMMVAGRLPEPAQVRTVVAAGPPASVLVYCLAPQTLAGWPFQLAPPAQAQLEQAGLLLGQAARGRRLAEQARMALDRAR